MTPRLEFTRRQNYRRAVNHLRNADAMRAMPGILESAAIDIGQHGWWKARWKIEPGESSPKCIWLAVEAALERFALGTPELEVQARCFIEASLIEHFSLDTLVEVMNLNDVQPDYEGQAWAIYHLNALAKKIRIKQESTDAEADS